MTNIQFGLRELDTRFIIDVVFFYNVINDQIRLTLDSRIQFSRELLTEDTYLLPAIQGLIYLNLVSRIDSNWRMASSPF